MKTGKKVSFWGKRLACPRPKSGGTGKGETASESFRGKEASGGRRYVSTKDCRRGDTWRGYTGRSGQKMMREIVYKLTKKGERKGLNVY